MPAEAESIGTNGHGPAVLEEIIQEVYSEHDDAGVKRPGRPTLVKLVRDRLAPQGISEHQVRQAKELVDAGLTSPPAPAARPGDPTPPAHQPAVNRPLVLWPQSPGQRLSALNEQLAGAIESANTPAPPPAATSPAPADHQPPASPTSWFHRVRQQRWALILISIGAGFSVWSGWVGLGEMAGYGPVQPLPGIWDSLTVNSAIVLPISVEAYGAYALRHWLSPATRQRGARLYAGFSALASLVVGGAAQVAYHELKAAGFGRAPWQVVMLVSLVPVAALALAAILAYLVKNDRQGGGQA